MSRVPPRRIRLNFRKRLIHKRLNPPNVAACVKHDLLTGFHAARPSFNKIQLYRTSRIGDRDFRDLDGRLGRHTPRITTGEKDANDYKRETRSPLLEGIVRGRVHTSPNICNTRFLGKPSSRSRGIEMQQGQAINPKHWTAWAKSTVPKTSFMSKLPSHRQ